MAEQLYQHLAGLSRAELTERLKDPHWRIRNLYYIKDKQGKTVLFKPNEVQEKFIAELWYRNVVPKARQRGFSTVVQLMMLDACLFNQDTTAAIIAQDQVTASKIMREKIEFAYERLPDFLRRLIPLTKDNVTEKVFSNGSSITVSTSARGTTLSWLHVSEFGVICFQSPLKADEIITGALPAAEAGITVIESTAKGRDGEYYKIVQTAKANAEAGKKLTKAEYKLHFASWWDADEYELDPEGVIITAKDHQYFDEKEREIGRPLPARKRAWYVSTRDNTFGGDEEKMWSEYPTTLDEAFKVSTEGVYLAKQLTTARQQSRIGRFPYRPGIPVNTFWDLGVDDDIAIWFHQTVGAMDHFIDYFECSNEAYDFVVRAMQAKGYIWGRHYLPHDGDQRRPGQISLQTPRDMLEGLGLSQIVIVPRTADLVAIGIQELRADFATYCFDEEKCSPGLVHLENYRKAWNQGMGVWSEYPAKNGHQHAADAIRQKAQASDMVRRHALSTGSTVPRRRNRSGMAV
ncbi:hypothetical protein [Shinella pollutisoli]|uniref:Terminase large subunit n=1 Tax=Shinella pollutisoli TaxID=2250594 RepID=A0ABV7DJ00_9HYPH|nr:hypothetical protein [Shinella pollutisoli]